MSNFAAFTTSLRHTYQLCDTQLAMLRYLMPAIFINTSRSQQPTTPHTTGKRARTQNNLIFMISTLRSPARPLRNTRSNEISITNALVWSYNSRWQPSRIFVSARELWSIQPPALAARTNSQKPCEYGGNVHKMQKLQI